MRRGFTFAGAMTAALVLVSAVVVGLGSVSLAQAGTVDHKPLKDYSVGGDIILNVPVGSKFTLSYGEPKQCAKGEPEYSAITTTRLREYVHVILRVLSMGEGDHDLSCVLRYSWVTWHLTTDSSLYAAVPFVQTKFETFTAAEFEVQCPKSAESIVGYTCKSINQRTVELTQQVPATLKCDHYIHFDDSRDTKDICEWTGWPAPSMKVTGLVDGKVLGLSVVRQPTDGSKDRGKVVLTGDVSGYAGTSDITIIADAPPYPTEQVQINMCPRELQGWVCSADNPSTARAATHLMDAQTLLGPNG
jgi:hypothetical protein